MSRYAIRAALVAAIDAATTVQVGLGHQGDQHEPDSIWLDASEGVDVNVPVFQGPPTVGNPLTYDDTFTIPIQIQAAAKGRTIEEAEAAVTAMYETVETVTRTNPKLVDEILTASLTAVEGPSTGRVRDIGGQSFMRATFTIRRRVST